MSEILPIFRGRSDLHIHTSSSRLWDGKHWIKEGVLMSASDVVMQAKRVDLEAVAITDHNTVDSLLCAREVAQREGIGFYPGVEISSKVVSRTPHILVYGEALLEMNDTELPTYESPYVVLSWAASLGLLAVVPHPSLYPEGDGLSLGAQEIREYRTLLSGIETANFYRPISQDILQLAKELKLPPVVNSDAHVLSQIGSLRQERMCRILAAAPALAPFFLRMIVNGSIALG